MIKRLLKLLLLLVVAAAAYLSLWPVPIKAVAWQAPTPPGYTGPHAPNYALAKIQTISLGQEHGPEHVAIGPDGLLYTAVTSGKILRMKPDGSASEIFADTGGRVLGFDFDAQGRLIAADAVRGLLAISVAKPAEGASPGGTPAASPTKAQPTIEVLADKHDGKPILYADAVVVAKSGKMYFSDASQRFSPAQWGGTFEASVLDILEQASTGRVLEYDPATKATRVLISGLAFANGVALSDDEQSLFVVETGKYRIWKMPVSVQNADVLGTPPAEVKLLFDNLPGYPDNLMRGAQGRIWVGLTKPRNPKIDDMAAKPFLRELTLRLPRSLWPIPKTYGHVFAFDEHGKVLVDLQDPAGSTPETTSVTETPERLYIQSLHSKSLAWLPNTLGKP